MNVRRLVLSIACIAGALSIVLFAAVWIGSAPYRRARLTQILDEPALVVGVGWPVWLGAAICVALVVSGALIGARALRNKP